MTFTEPVDPATAHVSLLDARGTEIAGVGTVGVDAAGTTVSASLPDLGPGTYTVSYQVISAADGHITSGIFAFLVDPTGTQPAPGVTGHSASLADGPPVIAARWLALAGALAAAGILLFWLFSARPALSGAGDASVPWGALALSAGMGLLGLVLYLMLSAAPILARGGAPPSAIPLDPAAPFGWTPFAIAMRVAMVGLAAATVLAAVRWLRFARDAGRTWLMLTLGATLLALAGMSLAGHAAADGPLFAGFDLLHLVGVAAWIGTLPGLFLLARRDRAAVPAALRRHSRLALVAAPVVVLSGLANSPVVLGASSRELVASGYGNLLLAKAILFSVAVAIGAANFFFVRRGTFARSLPVIAGELGIGALAVLAAAGMVTGQPAATRAPVISASAIGALHLYGVAGESSVHLAVNLPSPGEQQYQISVADATTGSYRTDVQRAFLVFSPPPDSGLASERVQLTSAADPGLWGTTGAYTPVVGSWQVEVVVRRAGVRDESVAFEVPVTEPLPPRQVPPPDIGVGVPLPLLALWAPLPDGAAAWAIPLALLAVALLLGLLHRRRAGSTLAYARLAAVALALVAGVAVGSREAVRAANATPPAAAAATNPILADEASVTRGHHLYLANCATCHGVEGAGDGPIAETMILRPRPLDAVLPHQTDGALAYRIAVGTAGTRMPAFAATLSENDRWDLVNYLRATWGRTEP